MILRFYVLLYHTVRIAVYQTFPSCRKSDRLARSATFQTMFLPRPGGRFPVGATTFKLAVPPCSLSSAKVRPASSELKQCLVLEEVAFTAYYPADVSPKNTPKGFSWLLRYVWHAP